MNISTELRGTIYHEVGHVVALCENGYIPNHVVIINEKTGSTDCRDADFVAMPDKAIFIIALAGIYAESEVRPEASVEEFSKIIAGGSSDRYLVDEEYRKRRGRATELALQVLHSAPKKFVQLEWAKIEKVAAALTAKGHD